MRSTEARGANLSRADSMLRRLADEGQRMTSPRETVVRAIAGRSGSFSAEDLAHDLHPEGVGRATVYRTLDLLERYEMVSRMHLDGCHGYALCEEGHHHHLVCTSCHAVVRVDASEVETEIKKLADRLQFRLDTHTLEFAGLCATCRAAAS